MSYNQTQSLQDIWFSEADIYTLQRIWGEEQTITNNGQAKYAITGENKIGANLKITEIFSDPDGNGTSSLSYSWQSSADNINWAEIANTASYTIISGDHNKYLKAVIYYTDADGYSESVSTLPISIPSLDPNGDGLVDDASTYQISTEIGGLEISTENGSTFNTSIPNWKITKVIETDSVYKALIEGQPGQTSISGTIDTVSYTHLTLPTKRIV